MTNQSHTELAAQARDWAVHLEQANLGRINQYIAHTLRRCAAALESPERVLGDMVLVPRVLPRHARMHLLSGEKSWATLLGLIATPSPQAEKQPLSLSELAVHQAVQMIADWPITDKKNMDAMNMQGIAAAALKVGIVTKESST